jgi:MoaA/NifB/PqqE/SkfB family radical SAM enzyme
VLGLLRAAGRPLAQSVIYAWNPLVLVEVWGTGHLDGALVPLVGGARWALVRNRYAGAGALLGVGALHKLYPAALLALVPAAGVPAAAAVFAGVVLLGYAPALVTSAAMLGSLPRYVTEEYFNPGLVRSLVDAPLAALAAAAAWTIAAAVVRRDAPLGERAVVLVGGLLLLSPNVFPWYAIWLVPLLAWAPSPAWIAFTGCIAFAYAFFLQQPWGVPGWARAVQGLPLALGAAWVAAEPALGGALARARDVSERPLPLRPPLPRSLYLETTSRCNSLCETCILTFGGREPQRDLTWGEFRRVVDQFPDLERVLLHGIGEPLLNRELPRMVAHLKARGARVLFNSNAITLSPQRARALIDAGLDELRVSLDASAAATYARIRGVDAFDKVVRNLEELRRVKDELRVAHPAVSLWFTALKDNIEEIPGLISLAGRAGAPEIHLQRLVYNGLGLATEEQSLYGRLHEREAALIEATVASAREAGVAFSASGAAAPEVSLTPAREGQPWSACRRPWTLAYVTVGGNVLPCCIAPWITGHYAGIILGNLYQESLEEVWWGQRYCEFRHDLQTREPPEPCRGCGVKWSL